MVSNLGKLFWPTGRLFNSSWSAWQFAKFEDSDGWVFELKATGKELFYFPTTNINYLKNKGQIFISAPNQLSLFLSVSDSGRKQTLIIFFIPIFSFFFRMEVQLFNNVETIQMKGIEAISSLDHSGKLSRRSEYQ